MCKTKQSYIRTYPALLSHFFLRKSCHAICVVLPLQHFSLVLLHVYTSQTTVKSHIQQQTKDAQSKSAQLSTRKYRKQAHKKETHNNKLVVRNYIYIHNTTETIFVSNYVLLFLSSMSLPFLYMLSISNRLSLAPKDTSTTTTIIAYARKKRHAKAHHTYQLSFVSNEAYMSVLVVACLCIWIHLLKPSFVSAAIFFCIYHLDPVHNHTNFSHVQITYTGVCFFFVPSSVHTYDFSIKQQQQHKSTQSYRVHTAISSFDWFVLVCVVLAL